MRDSTTRTRILRSSMTIEGSQGTWIRLVSSTVSQEKSLCKNLKLFNCPNLGQSTNRVLTLYRQYVKSLVAMNDQAQPVYSDSDTDSFGDVGTDIETQIETEKFSEDGTNTFAIPWIDRMDFPDEEPKLISTN